ncbi:MAG TPA: sugar O-acetyltransferase [Candidatus Obscuribacterales bacterium]
MSLTERDKMLANLPYLASDPALVALRLAAQQLVYLFNHLPPDQLEARRSHLRSLLGTLGDGVEVVPPFFCDYGCHIHLGRNVYINTNCTILDCNTVEIGDDVLIAPNVQIYTAYHPIDPAVRRTGVELAAPVRIGPNVWIGGGAILCPGVTIGADSVIGAGSVVTKSVPDRVVAVGNPCRVLRPVD